MFCAHKKQRFRKSAAVTAVALASLLLSTAAPASADGRDDDGATATLGGLKTYGDVELKEGTRWRTVQGGLFDLAMDGGGTLQTYCIDAFNPTQPRARYQETPWKESSLHNNPDAGKIRWILQNSYPQKNDLGALAAAAGVPALTAQQAAAGTQAAIWRYSDHIDARAKDPVAQKLAMYLHEKAQPLTEPVASLALTPRTLSGKSGEKLGPVSVETSADTVNMSLETDATGGEVTLVDGDGKPVTSAANGSRLYVDIPQGTAGGTAAIKATATTRVPIGRVFTGIGQHKGSQTMILAGSTTSTVTASTTVNWVEGNKPTPVPAVSAKKNCAKGGVDITATNKGDVQYTFSVDGKSHTVAPGGSRTVTVPVGEDRTYRIVVTLPGGKTQEFSGILDCETEGKPGEGAPGGGNGGGGGKPSPAPSADTTSGTGPADRPSDEEDVDGSLAATGGNSLTTPLAALAAFLILGGGTAVFLNRKRRKATRD